MIPIARPQMGEDEKQRVWEAMSSGTLAQGPRVAEFEEGFAAMVGVPHAVATSSGTTALHLALLGYDIGPGDEVITVPFTFVASATSVLHTGARPVLVDVREDDFTMDVSLVEAAITPRTKAILPVSLYGQPADLPGLAAIAERSRAGAGRGCRAVPRRRDRRPAQRQLGRRHLQLLPDEEHDHRRGRHGHHRRRRPGRADAPPARARHEGPLPPRRRRLQLPHDRSRGGHRPGPAAEARRLQRTTPRDRRALRRRAARGDHPGRPSRRDPRLPPVHDPGRRARRLRRAR